MSFHFGLMNFYFIGDEGCNYGSGVIASKLRVQLGRYRVTIEMHAEVFIEGLSSLKGRSVETALVTLENPEARASRTRLQGIAADLAALLGFVSMSQVGVAWVDRGGHRQLLPTQGAVHWYRPVLNYQDPSALREYLEAVWLPFRRQKQRRKLHHVLQYLILSDVLRAPLEMSYVLVVVALESLKATYADKVEGLQYVKASWRRPRAGTKPKHWQAYKFEELVRMMIGRVGIRRGLKMIVELRNEMVHTGFSRRGFETMDRHYERMHDLIREYLLRLLKFSGSYSLYARGPKLTKDLSVR